MYDHLKVEKNGRSIGKIMRHLKQMSGIFQTKVLRIDMFPLPKWSRTACSHQKSYTATDIVSRMKRMQDIMFYIQWDMTSFLVCQQNSTLYRQVTIKWVYTRKY